MTSRTLVAYYSMSGNTRAVANEIRDTIDADIEEIAEPHPRRGATGVIRALFDSIARRDPPILPAARDPAQYDVLLLGGPVWNRRMAGPLRHYARRYGAAAPHVAFFCTEGGRGAEDAFADLATLCGHEPEATLVVDAAHKTPAAHHADLAAFTANVRHSIH